MTSAHWTQRLAWALGLTGAASCAVALGATIAIGFTDQIAPLLFGYLFGILMGLLGAVIAIREPRNSIGWLMCLTSLATSLAGLPVDYAYAALVVHQGTWPLGPAMLWFGTWSSIPVFGLLLPLILTRFPNGRVRRRWRAADGLASVGTLAFTLSVALAPADLPLVSPREAALLAPFAHNPLGVSIPGAPLSYLWMSGLGIILLAYVASAGSLVARFRRASHDERIQLKWFAYAGVLIAVMAVYAGLAWDYGQSLGDALIPFEVALVSLPIAIGIAILRYRLYDIDLIINRTLVYGSLTAVVAALYTAGITFTQRLYVSATGQKSDAAYVLTAFAIVVAYSPIKDWLQKQVDRKVRRESPSAALEEFTAEVDAVISVIDVHRIAFRLVDEAVSAFDARGAALYLRATDASNPLYSRGHLNGGPGIEVPLRHEGRQLGRLVLAGRRGDATYTSIDQDTLQRCADSVGEALVIAAHIGFRPLPQSH